MEIKVYALDIHLNSEFQVRILLVQPRWQELGLPQLGDRPVHLDQGHVRSQVKLVGHTDGRTGLGQLVQNQTYELPEQIVTLRNDFGEQNSLSECVKS